MGKTTELKRKIRVWYDFKKRIVLHREAHRKFRCNICGNRPVAPLTAITGRETNSCYFCRSTLRLRTIARGISQALFSKDFVIPKFPSTGKVGVGISDHYIISTPLSKYIRGYANRFYHQEPKLDIMSIAPDMENKYDFVVCSDVFEHVKPPVKRGFENIFRLLKPGGFCVFSVPLFDKKKTEELYPDLYEYTIEEEDGEKVLKNVTRDGKEQRFANLSFHGGGGLTLVMRNFALGDIFNMLDNVGFTNMRLLDENVPEYGIYWNSGEHVPFCFFKPE